MGVGWVTKEAYEKANAIVTRYRKETLIREGHQKAKQGQKYIGKYFKIDSSYQEGSGHIDYRSYIKVLGCDPETGYDIIEVEDMSDYGRGFKAQRTNWSFGMETPYFGKDREITEEHFKTAMTYILGKMEAAPK